MVVDRFEIVEPRGVRRHEVGERLRDVVIELCAAALYSGRFIEIQAVKFRIGEKIPVVAEPVEISAEPKEAVARHGFKRLFRERSAARRGEHFGGCPVRWGNVRIIDVLAALSFPSSWETQKANSARVTYSLSVSGRASSTGSTVPGSKSVSSAVFSSSRVSASSGAASRPASSDGSIRSSGATRAAAAHSACVIALSGRSRPYSSGKRNAAPALSTGRARA